MRSRKLFWGVAAVWLWLGGGPERPMAQAVDTTPPTIVATLSRAPNANGWHRADVRVKFTCTDTGSRVAVCPAPVLVTTEGVGQVITGTARDRAGNTATTSVTVSLDKTPPVVDASVTPAAPAGGWHTGPVTVGFSATDALSGISPGSITPDVELATDRTNGSVTGRATDLAGNTATFKVIGINIDTRAPRVTVAFSPAPVGGYRRGPVTATFTCSDARSGVASCPADQVITAEGRDIVVTGTVVDHAGHTATVSKSIHIDTIPPVIAITEPVSTVVDSGTVMIRGTVSDGVSGVVALEADGVPVRRRTGGAFTYGPVPVSAGGVTVTLSARDRAGNIVEQPVVLTTPEPAPINLVSDPQFDQGTSGFVAQDASSTVVRTTTAPIEGSASLLVAITGYGNNVWWPYGFAGGRASELTVGARLRSEVASTSALQWCAMAYYADGTTALACETVDGAVGDKGTVSATLPLDAARPLTSVRIRLYQLGEAPVTFLVDAATAYLTVVEPPPTGGEPPAPNPDPNPNPNPAPGSGCAVSTSGRYPGFVYQLPGARPFISLSSYTQTPASSVAAQRLVAAAEAAVAGQPPYAYSATHAILAHARTGNPAYLNDAIARVEQFVSAAELVIAGGGRPAISGDSYLDVGWYLEQLALTYDRAFDLLTPEQRQRWTALAEQSLFNVWNPGQATWGGVAHPWSGWSVCDPGNNYHFSFLRATMMWALASQNSAWFDYLQTRKFGPLVDYYADLVGGGTREGTGYGTALNNLFGNLLIWRDSTGEDLTTLSPHTKETIDYWVHATVPTLDRFAPIGDLSRSSLPTLYDYHENLVHQAAVLSPGTPQAARGTWWLQQNSVNGVQHVFNIAGDLLPYPDAPVAPTDRVYHSPGAGALFARTSWQSNALWMSIIAGKYDQSHAHQDQGSFALFRNDWLTVTNNIWSQSGIHQGVPVHNGLRFIRSNGTVIPQTPSSTVQSSMQWSTSDDVTLVVADLANAYVGQQSLVQAWTRTLALSSSGLRVTDACVVADGVSAVFQIQVPVAPVLEADGTIQAGALRIVPLMPVSVAVVAMDPQEFWRGYRVDLTPTQGCAFDVELQVEGGGAPAPSPTPDPDPAPTPDPECPACESGPVPPVWSEVGPAATRIKSPAPQMRFTEGAPIRILADARDPNAWMCPPGHPPYVCQGSEVRFFVNGQLVAVAEPSSTNFNLWEARLPDGLPVGSHVLTVTFVPFDPATGSGGSPVAGAAPVTIHVDPAPTHGSTVSLSGDLVLTGAYELDWTDVTVIGNGYRLLAAPGYAGNVTIRNAHVSGLGTFDVPGVQVTTGGTITIEASIFEATGSMHLAGTGTTPVRVVGNEWRANNLLTYVSANPDVPVALEVSGTASATKVITGNRIGAGILRVRGNGWQIGGLDEGEGNVLLGPRAVLELVDSSGNVIQGNYLRHDYHGGFSQGFNLLARGSSAQQLVEHNVIRGGSWPVQGIGGQFRYNLVVDSGHNFWRSVKADTQIHHNLFVHANGPNTGYDGAVQIYDGQTGISVFNNTFDGGGAIGRMNAAVFNIGSGAGIDSIHNNLFTGFSAFTSFGGALVSTAGGAVTAPRVTSADYNAWHNPLAAAVERYLAGIVAQVPGLSDVIGPPFLAGQPEVPYRISEGCVWTGTCTVGQVLAHYRSLYRPAAGSPLIGAGDPAGGPGAVIGAIGTGDAALDKFGRIVK